MGEPSGGPEDKAGFNIKYGYQSRLHWKGGIHNNVKLKIHNKKKRKEKYIIELNLGNLHLCGN